jgi:Leucine-rich repeat (LRR) protein
MTTDVQRALADLVDAGAVAPGTQPSEVADLVVSHARSLEGLERFARLETLSLLSCEVGDYTAVASLPALRVLAVENSDLVDLAWAEDLELHVAVLRRNRIRDATVVVGLTGLQVLDVSGNPLDPRSRSAPRSLAGPLVTLDDDDLTDVNVMLADAGVPLVGYRAGDTVQVCATGLTLTSHPEAGHVATSIDDLAAVARGERSPADLLGLVPDPDGGTHG